MRQAFLIVLITLICFGSLLLLGASEDSKQPLPPIQQDTPLAKLQPGRITMTIVATTYLPVVLNNYSLTPVISTYDVKNDDINNCSLGSGSPGTSFTISFNYLDANGDVGANAMVSGTATFRPSNDEFAVTYPSTSLTITGTSSGTVSLTECIRFAKQNRVEFSLSLTDNAGFQSNTLFIPIDRPTGAN